MMMTKSNRNLRRFSTLYERNGTSPLRDGIVQLWRPLLHVYRMTCLTCQSVSITVICAREQFWMIGSCPGHMCKWLGSSINSTISLDTQIDINERLPTSQHCSLL